MYESEVECRRLDGSFEAVEAVQRQVAQSVGSVQASSTLSRCRLANSSLREPAAM